MCFGETLGRAARKHSRSVCLEILDVGRCTSGHSRPYLHFVFNARYPWSCLALRRAGLICSWMPSVHINIASFSLSPSSCPVLCRRYSVAGCRTERTGGGRSRGRATFFQSLCSIKTILIDRDTGNGEQLNPLRVAATIFTAFADKLLGLSVDYVLEQF